MYNLRFTRKKIVENYRCITHFRDEKMCECCKHNILLYKLFLPLKTNLLLKSTRLVIHLNMSNAKIKNLLVKILVNFHYVILFSICF